MNKKTKKQRIIKAIEEFEHLLMSQKAKILDDYNKKSKELENKTNKMLQKQEEILTNSFFKAVKEDMKENKDYYINYAKSTNQNDEFALIFEESARIKIPKDIDNKIYQKFKQILKTKKGKRCKD